jgi:hypothetical protein
MIQVTRIVNGSRQNAEVQQVWLNAENILAVTAVEQAHRYRSSRYPDTKRWTTLEFPNNPDGYPQIENITESVDTVLARLAQVGVTIAPPAEITPIEFFEQDD